MKRAVFLDRDGTLLDGWGSIFPGTRKQLDRLKDAGFWLVVVTNQPDVATGKMDPVVMDRVHDGLLRALKLHDLLICPHVKTDECDCHKPKPGMLLSAASMYDLDLSRSFMVGDRWRDIGAGANAGCTTILIGTGYGEPFKWKPDHRAADLETAVDIILESA